MTSMNTILAKNSIKEMIDSISVTSDKLNFNIVYDPTYIDCILQVYYKDYFNETRVYIINDNVDKIHTILNDIINNQNGESLAFNLAKRIMCEGNRVI